MNPSDHIYMISEGFVDPSRYIFDLDDAREVWYDKLKKHIVWPVHGNKALLAIKLLNN